MDDERTVEPWQELGPAIDSVAAAMMEYGRAVSEALAAIGDVPARRQQQPAFMRPAWQRRA